MPLSLILACLWAVIATLLALLPSRRHHWPAATGLIVVGIPLLGYVTWQTGPTVGLLVLAAGVSILRWPLIHLGRWLRRSLVGPRVRADAPDPAKRNG